MNLSLRPISLTDWPAVAAGFRDLTFEQTRAYAAAAAARIGARLEPVGVAGPDGRWLAAAALRVKPVPGLGRGIAWAPSGPLILPQGGADPDKKTLTALLATFRQGIAGDGGHILRLRLSGTARRDPADFAAVAVAAGFSPALHPRPYRSFALDLGQTSAALMAALNGKWRTDLRFALKSGLVVERGSGPAITARFMAMFGGVQAAKGFAPDIPPSFHFPLSDLNYRVETLIVRKDGQDLAGIVVGTCAASVTYLFGATTEAARPLRAGYALQWQAILAAQAEGCLWYDLGGVDFDTNPDVARFKERMHGVPVMAEVFEARPHGLVPALIAGAEALRARLKRR